MYIAGISAYYHDSAAALLHDGVILAAAQEERFTRKKHDAAFPEQALRYCLQQAGIPLSRVDWVVFYDKPFLKFERLLETYLAFAPRGFASFRAAIPLWIKEKLFQKKVLLAALRRIDGNFAGEERLLFAEHHQSHAASAFYPSPFAEAAVLTMDGVGEWATTSTAIGRGHALSITREIHFPHSLGLLYSAFTHYLGFRVNSGEYKLMGLAPYGVPRHGQKIFDHLLDLKEDGSFRLDLDYFDYCTGLAMTNEKFHGLFQGAPRQPEQPLTQHHMDVAASIQQVVEEVVVRLTRDLARQSGLPDLCLAGGVALNCVANGKVLRDGAFRRLWVQPAAGDAGGAVGAALAAHHGHLGQPRVLSPQGGDAMRGAYLGPDFSREEIVARLTAAGATFTLLPEQALLAACVAGLQEGKALGWFQGRMEFGPRALGARSILGDARSPVMQSVLNLKVKFRESFRPFAPAVLAEHAADWFDLRQESPYMLLVAEVLAGHRLPLDEGQPPCFGIERLRQLRSVIPAVTHVDYSARVQTVHADTNPRFHALLRHFYRETGCPVLVNTSFNVRGEPIVLTPEDAFQCFMGTGMELLAVGDCLLRKEEQDPALSHHQAARFAPD